MAHLADAVLSLEPYTILPSQRLPFVLFVDDDPVWQDLLEATFFMAGGLCTAFRQSGYAALQAAQGHFLDLAVLDYDMPGMNGPQLAVKLRSLYPKIKLVLHSARTAFNASELQLFDAVCLKGHSETNLIGVVQELLRVSPLLAGGA